MKKTTTINLAGLVFHIEETGYQTLKTYFDDLRRIFSKEEGMEDMLNDIESRFAELFTERMNASKEVITEEDVEEVIGIMGSPHQYDTESAGDAEQEYAKHQNFGQEEYVEKRLFRDKDKAIIGGVAAGTGHYFNIDPVLVRILWIAFVFLGGSGFLIYIIAWMIIPEAKTTSEKLQMHGKSPNLDNIKMYMDKATEEAKAGYHRMKKTVKPAWEKSKQQSSAFLDVVLKIVGILMIIGGISSLFGILFSFFFDYSQINFGGESLDMGVQDLLSLFFIHQMASFWFILLLSVIPVIFFITLGVKLFFRHRLRIKNFSLSLLGIWILTLVGVIFLGIKSGVDFKEKYSVEEVATMDTSYTTLSLFIREEGRIVDEYSDNDFDNPILFEKGKVILGYVEIEVASTVDSLYSYQVEKRINGQNQKAAKLKARNIHFEIQEEAEKIIVDSYYSFPKEDKFRAQKVKLKVFVPQGKEITLNGDLEDYPIKVKTKDSFSKSALTKTSTWMATENGMELQK